MTFFSKKVGYFKFTLCFSLLYACGEKEEIKNMRSARGDMASGETNEQQAVPIPSPSVAVEVEYEFELAIAGPEQLHAGQCSGPFIVQKKATLRARQRSDRSAMGDTFTVEGAEPGSIYLDSDCQQAAPDQRIAFAGKQQAGFYIRAQHAPPGPLRVSHLPGRQGLITAQFVPAAPSALAVSIPDPVLQGQCHEIKFSAQDPYGNDVTVSRDVTVDLILDTECAVFRDDACEQAILNVLLAKNETYKSAWLKCGAVGDFNLEIASQPELQGSVNAFSVSSPPEQSPTPTETHTSTPTHTHTPTPTHTHTSTAVPTATATNTFTPVPTATRTHTRTATPVPPTSTPTPVPPTSTPTRTPTVTPIPTATPTFTATPVPNRAPVVFNASFEVALGNVKWQALPVSDDGSGLNFTLVSKSCSACVVYFHTNPNEFYYNAIGSFAWNGSNYGVHTFSFYATDYQGLSSATATITVTLVKAAASSIPGVSVGGYNWHISTSSQSCTSVCSSLSKTVNTTGLAWADSAANCQQVLNVMDDRYTFTGIPKNSPVKAISLLTRVGCFIFFTSTGGYYGLDAPGQASSSDYGVFRLCPCN